MKKLLLILCTSVVFGEITMNEVIDEYYPDYCHSLEAAYGEGFMSEGGGEALDFMFKDFQIHGKKALDIGSGLGGVAQYLAKKYSMDITGLEINPWMVREATSRVSKELQGKVRYLQSVDNNHLPFEESSFDIVYSKGVLCHVEDKRGIFAECYRILKPGGVLIINDWLSPFEGKWGENVQRLVELEGLSLHAKTVDGYLLLLKEANFKEIDAANLTEQYTLYNEEIVRELKTPEKKESFTTSFSEKLHEEAIEGYQSIANAMQMGEGMVMLFSAHKEK